MALFSPLQFAGYGRFIGHKVKINRGGPESITGVLLAVRCDYLVVKTKEGIVYVNSDHVKSVTDLGAASRSTGHSRFINAFDFKGVLRHLQYHFVQINWGGPEKIAGFVANVGINSLILLDKKKDITEIPLFHIKTVLATGATMKSGGDKKDDKKDKKDDKKDKKDDKKNKSSGSKSGGGGSAASKSGGSKSGGAKQAAAVQNARRLRRKVKR
ncbi:hypothetical protein AB6A23_19125 [Paenibacillus tarimensis]